MPPATHGLLIAALVVVILGGGVYIYKNVSAGCLNVPFIGMSCGAAVGK